MTFLCISIEAMQQEVFYGIALKLMKGIGDTNARQLITYAGSAEQIFRMSPEKLKKLNGIGPKLAAEFRDTYEVLRRAEQEMKFIERQGIQALLYYDPRYPKRLLNCPDAPLFLFCKGHFDFNRERFVSVVGTRHATEYGRMLTEQLVRELAASQVSLVSGLAFGIDICAHKAALDCGMQNIAVLAHGLDRVYPGMHKSVTKQLQQNGAVVSDYLSGTQPERQNFPSRNRIVAGMADATIVVESAEAGGALITAEIADSYNRDVFAFPGRVGDAYSSGCHQLIRANKAMLVTAAADILSAMNWDSDTSATAMPVQQSLFIELNEEEKMICACLEGREKAGIDFLSAQLPLPWSVLAGQLLSLEMKGVIKALPGKMYTLLR